MFEMHGKKKKKKKKRTTRKIEVTVIWSRERIKLSHVLMFALSYWQILTFMGGRSRAAYAVGPGG